MFDKSIAEHGRLYMFFTQKIINRRARGTFFEVGVLKKLESSKWSVNQRGVQGPAVGPLVGSRGNAPGGGSGGGGPGSSEVLDICIQSDGPILRPFL